MIQNTRHQANTKPQQLPEKSFVLPELTLLPFEPGKHTITLARIDHPTRVFGGASFPNIMISVLPGPAMARVDDKDSAWLTQAGEAAVVEVQAPGAILVFLTFRPSNYETTGLHIQIKKADAAQEASKPAGGFTAQPSPAMPDWPEEPDHCPIAPSAPFAFGSQTDQAKPVGPPVFRPQAKPQPFPFPGKPFQAPIASDIPGDVANGMQNFGNNSSSGTIRPQFEMNPFQATPIGRGMQSGQPTFEPSNPLPQARPFAPPEFAHNTQRPHGAQGENTFANSPRPVEPTSVQRFEAFQAAPANAGQVAFGQHPSRPDFFQELKPVHVHACGHIQNNGDIPCQPGQTIGSPASRLRLEAVAFKPEGIDPSEFEYATVSHDGRLSPWTSFPHFSGTRGTGTPLVGFVARLTGDAASKYDVAYAGTFLTAGQAPEARNGQFLQSPVQGDPLESLSLRVVPKNA